MSQQSQPATTTYRDPKWLIQHNTNILNFYFPSCIDNRLGGYIGQLTDSRGQIYDSTTKHLLTTTRFVHEFAVGLELGGPDWCRSAAEHGLQFLANHHRDPDTGGYPWILDGTTTQDDTYSTYGHSFVLLAYSKAAEAGVPGAIDFVEPTADILDQHFFEPEHGLYKGDLNSDWSEAEDYRGQNANMHACEAMLAAHQATNQSQYLDRAYTIAENIALELADDNNGLLWEHYTSSWEVNKAYNRNQPDHSFRPWGYQPGHLLEWSKLLLQLNRHRDEDWLVDRAKRFFDAATGNGWDNQHGGFFYTFDDGGDPVVEDKYYWPLAEGFAAAAMLGSETGDEWYWEWYDRIWEYAWENMVNQKYGNWYTKLTRDNTHPEDADTTPAVEVGYHPSNAIYETMRTLGET